MLEEMPRGSYGARKELLNNFSFPPKDWFIA